MKTKKLYLFAAVFLFLSVFFVGVEKTIAMDCYELCADEYDMQTCFDNCSISNNGITGWDDSGLATNFYDSTSETGLSNYCDTAEGQNDPSCTSQYDYYNTDAEGVALANCNDTNGTWDSNIGACSWTTTSAETDSTCDSRSSCMFWNCCPETSVQEQAYAQTPANKTAQNAATSNATAATTIQNAAAQRVNTELAQQDLICRTSSKEDCDEATKSLNEAKAAYDAATEDAQAAIENAGGFSGYTSNGTLGGGVNYGVNVGFGGAPGVSAGSAASCGAGFEKMGGVCFPTTTGLSSAPISTILSNLFLWLMGLFVTFAVVAFVVSGIQYLLAAGDEGMAETAKKNATNAIIGIIVGLSGFIIFKAIAAALSGQSYLF